MTLAVFGVLISILGVFAGGAVFYAVMSPHLAAAALVKLNRD